MITSSKVDLSILFDAMFAHLGGKIEQNSNKIYNAGFISRVNQTPKDFFFILKNIHDNMDEATQKKWKIPNIEFGLLDHFSPNCYAKLRGKNYGIGMSAMIPYCALELVSFFFADPDFYPEFGDTKKPALVRLDGVNELPFFQIATNSYRPLLSESLSDRDSLVLLKGIYTARGQCCAWNPETGKRFSGLEYIEFNKSIIDLTLPRCPKRRQYCYYFAHLLTTFFWLHEIAHCSENHLSYLVQNSAGNTLMEIQEGIAQGNKIVLGENVSDELINAMENEADQEALLVMIGLMTTESDLLNHEGLNIAPLKAVEVFCFFICALFSSYERYERRRFTVPRESHPRGTVRIVNMITTLMTLIEGNGELEGAVIRSFDYAKDISAYSRYRHLDCIRKGMGHLKAMNFDNQNHYYEVLSNIKDTSTGVTRLLCYPFFTQNLPALTNSKNFRMPSFLDKKKSS